MYLKLFGQKAYRGVGYFMPILSVFRTEIQALHQQNLIEKLKQQC